MRWPIAWLSRSACGSRSRCAGCAACCSRCRHTRAARPEGGDCLMKISANGIALEIEDHGSPQGEPLLLIMGLGMQLVAWHEDFVESLVQRGFRVIRFDNRDIGLSENFDRFGAPKLGLDMLRFAIGMRVSSPYTLADMAGDSVGILDALGIPKAQSAARSSRPSRRRRCAG